MVPVLGVGSVLGGDCGCWCRWCELAVCVVKTAVRVGTGCRVLGAGAGCWCWAGRWCCRCLVLVPASDSEVMLPTVKGNKLPLAAVKGDQAPLLTMKCQHSGAA